MSLATTVKESGNSGWLGYGAEGVNPGNDESRSD